MSTDPYTFAIVGMGPRGSYALECLIACLDGSPHQSQVRLLLFHDAADVGAGPVYDLDQPESNWINITERALRLDGRAELSFAGIHIPAFPSYHKWAELPQDPWPASRTDTFPPRAHVGKYLHARAHSLIQPLENGGVATFVNHRVRHLSQNDRQWSITNSQGQEWLADEVLLTIGHQPTSTDDQITGWKNIADSNVGLSLHTDPYPTAPIVEHATALDGDITIAIRGYGLAMMDVVRRLALTFGEFVASDRDDGEITYRQTSGGVFQVVPFSLDGLPMSPKPLKPANDALFAPTDEELAQLQATLQSRVAQANAEDAELLIDAIVPIAARVFQGLPDRHPDAPTDDDDLTALIGTWLKDADTEHPSLSDHSTPPEQVLRRSVAMASGNSPVSVDYCLGQVWRHCHPTIYASLSYNELREPALGATIALDERVKRYSFGPPVESIRQLCALAAAGVLDLDFVVDTDIVCDEHGWTLSSAGRSVTASTMVDSVLDSPQIEKVVAPLIVDLLSDSVLQPVHDRLGIVTNTDATVRSANHDDSPTLAVLGRLAKGTVIGVDAILECFGERPQHWAEGACARLPSARQPSPG